MSRCYYNIYYISYRFIFVKHFFLISFVKLDTLPNGPTLPPKFTILTNLNLRYSKLLSIERKLSCMVNWLLAEYFKSPTPPLLPRKCDFDKLESTLLVSKDASAKVFAFLTKWGFFFLRKTLKNTNKFLIQEDAANHFHKLELHSPVMFCASLVEFGRVVLG